MPDRHLAYIGLGANLNAPALQVRKAMDELAAQQGIRVISRSSLYLSQPAGYVNQPDYINAVVGVETSLSPRALLNRLLEIERLHGRERAFRNSPRTLDLDILLYDSLEVNEPGLHIPHPRMHERAFVLRPLAEIAPGIRLTGHGLVTDLLHKLAEDSVHLLKAAD